jgi:hypothetical protein
MQVFERVLLDGDEKPKHFLVFCDSASGYVSEERSGATEDMKEVITYFMPSAEQWIVKLDEQDVEAYGVVNVTRRAPDPYEKVP